MLLVLILGTKASSTTDIVVQAYVDNTGMVCTSCGSAYAETQAPPFQAVLKSGPEPQVCSTSEQLHSDSG